MQAAVTLRLVLDNSQLIASPAELAFNTSDWNVTQIFELIGIDNNQSTGNRTLYLAVNSSSADRIYGSLAAAPAVDPAGGDWCQAAPCNPFEELAPVCARARSEASVTVPAGVPTVLTVTVELDDGTSTVLTVPPGLSAGDTFSARVGPKHEVTFPHMCAARHACAGFLYGRQCDGRSSYGDALAVLPVVIGDDDTAGILVLTAYGGTQSQSNGSRAVNTAANVGSDSGSWLGGGFQQEGAAADSGAWWLPMLSVSEDGLSDFVAISLLSEPVGDVNVTFLNDPDGTTGQQLNFGLTHLLQLGGERSEQLRLTFNTSNWWVPQNVSVGGADDSTAEDNYHVVRLFVQTNSTMDAVYQRGSEHIANITIHDNDVALVSIHAPFESTGIEEGQTSSYKVSTATLCAAQLKCAKSSP